MGWPGQGPVRAVAFAVGGLLALTGCDGGGETPAFQVRDSSGVRIVESFRPLWEEGGGWELASGPLLRIGVVEGDAAQQFDGITGVAMLEDGTLVVADGGSQEVRFFDPSGDVNAVVGGPGEGPGEFLGLSGLGLNWNGSIWAYDFSLRRITWLNREGEVEGVASLGNQPPTLNSVGSLPDGTFVLKQLWGSTQGPENQQTRIRRDPIAFVRFDAEGALVDTLGLFPGREIYVFEEDGRAVMSTPPFDRNAVGIISGEGVVVGTQDLFELKWYGSEGVVRKVVRLPDWDLTLSPEDMEGYIQDRLADVPSERRPGLRAELEALPAPGTKPAYGGLLADRSGNLWVADWASYPNTPEEWTVFDPSGRWLGHLELPEGLFPYAIGEDWVLGVTTDELDVEYVVLYALLKG